VEATVLSCVKLQNNLYGTPTYSAVAPAGCAECGVKLWSHPNLLNREG